MAGKRTATTDLNHDNWNQDDEPEERGTFQKAPEEALKNRVIRSAKRRNPIRNEDGEKTSAFVGFTGFTNKPASADFQFIKNLPATNNTPKINGIDKPATTDSTSFNMFSNATSQSTNMFSKGATAASVSTNIFGSSISTSTSNTIVPSGLTGNKKSENYCARLKGLNESVSKWISRKVEENPLISLQPIFKDYEKYLGDIEKEETTSNTNKKENKRDPTNNPVPTFNFTPSADKNTKAIPDSTSEKIGNNKTDSTIPTFKYGGPTASVSSSGPTFSFGMASGSANSSFTSGTSSSSLGTVPTFSFGSNNVGGSSTFPTSSGFSFGSITKSAESEKPKSENNENNANDEDEPPKVEFKPVVEKDHIYTIRCKVFIKKGDSFTDRGVGNLYLKPIDKSEKVQLIVRADTNLGNLLLNLILSESVPTKRMGKKDVMIVAIPTPDTQPPPVPLLLRVKSPEDADKLLEILEKHKK